ncbi:MAG TPA: ABC transporter permease [Ignavibacteriales bacterium]|nr:ABC transporter permease [Ignavibacteriales bacterium]
MKNVWVIILFTLREAVARKVFIFFMGITLLVLLIMALVFGLTDTQSIMALMNPTGEETILVDIIRNLEFLIVNPLANLGLLLAIFSSASFIPVMLEQGNIDLLLSKPVSRTQLLIGKYLGVLLFVFINIFVFVFGVWFIISVKFGYWDASFLLISVLITFAFALLYALIVLFNVTTKSSIPGMMAAYLIFLIVSPLMLFYKEQLHLHIESGVIKLLLDGLYYVVPQTAELMGRMLYQTASGNIIENFQPVITSILFIILTLSFSIFIFRKKDF